MTGQEGGGKLKKLNYTPGPWKWRHAQLNENIAKRLKKSRSKITKTDGALLLHLAGIAYGGYEPDSEYLQNTCDWANWRCVFRLPWHAIKGSSFFGGPCEDDMRLIQCSPEMYEALEPVEKALELMPDSQFASLFDESLNPQSHCDITLTVAEARAIVQVLKRARTEEVNS